jgi:DNA-binding NtrC family response regulator
LIQVALKASIDLQPPPGGIETGRKGSMKKKIIILDADQTSSVELSKMLSTKSYPITYGCGLSLLEDELKSGQYVAVVLDIDSIPIDNRTIRELAIKYPAVRFLCTSKDRFHPELKDAICYHIYACLNKPVDPDELLFWIKSIYEEEEMPDA